MGALLTACSKQALREGTGRARGAAPPIGAAWVARHGALGGKRALQSFLVYSPALRAEPRHHAAAAPLLVSNPRAPRPLMGGGCVWGGVGGLLWEGSWRAPLLPRCLTTLSPPPCAGVVHQGGGGRAPLPGACVPPRHRAAAERRAARQGAAAPAAPVHQEGGFQDGGVGSRAGAGADG